MHPQSTPPAPIFRGPILVARIAGALITAVGALVLVGWYTRSPHLLKVHPSFVAMQFNTAAAFVLAGASILAASRSRPLLSGACAAAVALLGSAVLVEYVWALDLGIDLLLWRLGVDRAAMESYTVLRTSAPGRMAPNTALSFSLFGVTMLALLASARLSGISAQRLAGVASVLGTLVAGLGVVAFLGYLVGTPSAFGWANLSRMAVHTALGVTAVGVGVVALSAARLRSGGTAFMDRLPWLVAAGGLIVTLGLFQAVLDQQQEQIRRDVEQAAERLRGEVAWQIHARLQPLVRMGKRWEFKGRPRRADWEYEAGLNLADPGGYQAIEWVDADARARWVVPLEANRVELGRNVAAEATRRVALERARERRTLAVSRSVDLAQGGRGFLAVKPLFIGERFDGFIIGTFRSRELLDSTFAAIGAADYAVAIGDGEEQIYATGPAAPLPGTRYREVDLSVADARWRMRVWPTAAKLESMKSIADEICLVVGLLLTAVVAWTIHLSHTARAREAEAAAAAERLRHEAALNERAAELSVTNANLRREAAERRRAESEREGLSTEFERQRALFEAVIQQMPAAVIVGEAPSGRLVLANAEVERSLRYPFRPASAVAQYSQYKGYRPDGSEYQVDQWPLARAILKGEVITGEEITLLRGDGTRGVGLFNAAPVRDPDGRIVAGVVTWVDISERKQLEEQLRQSQKLEAVGQLAGGVAHDFNNMLTAIKCYSELLLSGLDETDARREDVEEIKKAADRAARLTSQLLAFSRKQILQPKVLDLNAAVGDMEKMLRRLIREDIEIRVVPAPDLRRVEADPGQIEQILMNLVVNARDAMPHGGTITIETANVELDEHYASVHAVVQPGSYVVLTVSDTGIGMDRETQARIFEPFFTTKERGAGTGLGLSTVYGIVKQSGGYVWVYSEPGQGTTFKIYLPRLRDAAEAPAVVAAPAVESSRGAEVILLAEDEEAVRSLVGKILRKHGYTVLEAQHGRRALELCEEHDGPIHLILTDVVMPQLSGVELVERLEALRPDARVLFMSGYTDGELGRRGVLSERVAFLQKPFTPAGLARKVREVLDTPTPAGDTARRGRAATAAR